MGVERPLPTGTFVVETTRGRFVPHCAICGFYGRPQEKVGPARGILREHAHGYGHRRNVRRRAAGKAPS